MTFTPDQLEQMIRALPPRSLRKTVFGLALAYSQTASSAMNGMAESGNADFAGPAIVCQSFAIELLLKFFIINDQPHGETYQQLIERGMTFGGRKRGVHGYSPLFNQLRPATKDKIAKIYSEVSGIQTDAEKFGIALVSNGEEPFIKWRYIYETGSISSFDQTQFSNVLQALGEAASAELHADPN